MKRMVGLWIAMAALPLSAQAAERYKLLPSDADQAQMEQTVKPGSAVTLNGFLAEPQSHFWVAFYQAAQQLFDQGRKDEAVKWFFAGQIRARVAAGLDPDSSRNNAMLVALNNGIGAPIMDYAKSDKKNWGEQIDAALAWDKKHPLPAKPKAVIGVEDVAFDTANFQALYDEVRAGLQEMRAGL